MTLNKLLIDEDLNVPPIYDGEVLKAANPPFSDRLSLFWAVTMTLSALTSYSTAKINTMRKDVFLKLTQLSGEIVLNMKDGMDIMIDNGWYEEPPKNVDFEDVLKN